MLRVAACAARCGGKFAAVAGTERLDASVAQRRSQEFNHDRAGTSAHIGPYTASPSKAACKSDRSIMLF
jgi:hypothetical protein